MVSIEQSGIVCVCIFIGAFVRGVAGLGMAVVYMTMWVIFSVLQLDTGNLRHVVAALTLNILIGSFPLLYIFEANKFGDYGITIPMVVFANLGCLIGTHLLETLPIKQLQLALAIALSVVVVLRAVQQTKQIIKEQKKRKEEKRLDEEQSLIQDEIKMPLNGKIEEGEQEDVKNQGENKLEALQEPPQKSKIQRILIGTRDALSKFGWVILLFITAQITFEKQDRPDFLTTFQITKNPKSCINSKTLKIEYSQSYLNNLSWFILAGFLSGFLGCLVGVPGPPIIIMFQLLPFQRNTIRVLATVFEVFTFRPIIFFFNGGLFFEDIPMYILSILSMLVGMFIGSLLCNKISQKWFVRIMDAIILVSTIMTFLKAFEIVPQH